MNKDTLVVPLSDFHSGGTTALFLDRFWQGKHNNHTPTSKQVAIHQHFDKCIEQIKVARKNKKVLIVHDGDAIEGDHHATVQVVTQLENEQAAIHVELMEELLSGIGFSPRNGDELAYVSGTDVHTGDIEDFIAEKLPVTPNGERLTFDIFRKNVGGRDLWFTHRGPKRSKGSNAGNGIRNWLRDLFWDLVREGRKPPDYIITGHWHTPDYNSYIQEYRGEWIEMYGMICPSWQAKTRYAYGIVPAELNRIGVGYFTITGDGYISRPTFVLMDTE